MDDFSLPLATPDVNGSNWSGYYAVTGTSTYIPITASIYQSGSNVEVVTSKSGMGHRLSGTINSSGYMYMYDHYDGEIWTTHYGPATSSNVRLYDYVCPTCSQLYVIALTRPAPPVAPKPPSIVAASNGLYLDKVEVAWSTSLGATSYQVYRCTSLDTGSCTHITDAATSPYVDTELESHTTYYYRVKACSSAGCSDFSSFGIGYKKIPEAIMPLIYELLFE